MPDEELERQIAARAGWRPEDLPASRVECTDAQLRAMVEDPTQADPTALLQALQARLTRVPTPQALPPGQQPDAGEDEDDLEAALPTASVRIGELPWPPEAEPEREVHAQPASSASSSDDALPTRTQVPAPLPAPAPGDNLLSVAMPGWHAGALIATRYRLLERLGTGGMGDVLLADDLLLRRKVAIKTLRKHYLANPAALDRFRMEVALAHSVSHPGLARTFDMGEANGVVFLTMEYLVGETLAQRLEREGPLPFTEVRRIALEVAAAMETAHQEGVVHRDLKPSNIQLTPDRGAVVMDFGLAAAIHEHRPRRHPDGRSELVRPSTKSAGTPNYMAPEQWRSEPQGAATDIYAFGCILFEMLTGRIPFQAQTRTEMMQQHLEAPVPPLHTLRPGVPLELEQLLLDCLAKQPDRRPASMFEVARRLIERPLRRMAITSALALAALLLVVGSGIVIWEVSSILLLREIRPAVQRLAMLAARDLEGTELDRIRRPADIGTPPFQAIWEVLNRIKQENDEVTSIYTLRKLKAETMWEFVVDANPLDQDENGNGTIDEGEQGAPPGLRYDATNLPMLRLAFLSDRAQADTAFTWDDWGLSLSGYAPIRPQGANAGDDFYIVGVDVGDSPLTILRITTLVIFLVLGLASATLVIVMRRRQGLLLAGFGRVRVR